MGGRVGYCEICETTDVIVSQTYRIGWEPVMQCVDVQACWARRADKGLR